LLGLVVVLNHIIPIVVPESCWVSIDQSVSHSSVLVGTLLNSTPVS
jgi:hypothetical protein